MAEYQKLKSTELRTFRGVELSDATHIVRINSVDELYKMIELHSRTHLSYIFRGQRSDYSLLSGLQRENLHQMVESNFESILREYITKQHSGKEKTYLLDWSNNIWIAFHFACNSALEKDCYIYAVSIAVKRLMQQQKRVIDYCDNPGLYSSDQKTSKRIISQGSKFTFSHTATSVEQAAKMLLEKRPAYSNDVLLVKYIMPVHLHQTIRQELKNRGISNTSLHL
jgi:hypothetical protein